MIKIYQLHLKILTALLDSNIYLYQEIKELRQLIKTWDKKPFNRIEMAEIEKEILGRKLTNRERQVELRKLNCKITIDGIYKEAINHLMDND